MKKLIPVQGKGIKGVVEISDGGIVVKPDTGGQLWLYDGGLVPSGEWKGGSPTGAIIINQEGSPLMWGGIGRGERAERILAEAVMRSGREERVRQKQEPPLESKAGEAQDKPKEERKAPPANNNESRGVSMPPNPGAALLEILKKAEELFPPQTTTQRENRDDSAIINPFPEAFPLSRWHRREYPGTNSCYLEGEWLRGGVTYRIYAIPGEQRGRRHRGFSRFLRSRDGSGYWVKVQRK